MTTIALEIIKTGNQLAIILPQTILDSWQLHAGEVVDGAYGAEQSLLMIKPVNALTDDIDLDFVRQVNEFIDTYRPALEALAQ